MRLERLALGCTATVLLLVVGCATAGADVHIPSTDQYDVRSTVSGRDYRVFVALPESYQADGHTARYPVLYVLDGNDAFPIAVGAYRYLRLTGEVPDLIIVGIGYPVDFYRETLVPRYTDYTPSSDPREDSVRAPQFASFLPDRQEVQLKSGGGADFLASLRQDIVPMIERTYRVTDDRALWGHSLAGSFALYVLLTAPETFARYAIHSPAVWWNGRDVYDLEKEYADSHHDLPARVFISVGADEGDVMVSGADSIGAVLQRRGHPSLVLTTHTFGNESHMSSVPPALSRALRVLYVGQR